MSRLPAFRLASVALFALWAAAPVAATPVDSVLDAAPDPVRLRAGLLTVAGRPATPAADAARAWRLAGVSHDRAGRLDSAIVCHERAAAIAPDDDAARAALAEALLARDMPGDVARADSLLAARLASARRTGGADVAEIEGWIAWSHYLAGRPDTARARFAALEAELLREERPLRWVWRYRMTAALAGHDRRQAIEMATPLLERSRGMDEGLVSMLKESLGGAPRDPLAMYSRSAIVAADREEAALLQPLGARRVAFLADDGFPLGAIVLTPAGGTRRRAVIALIDPDGSWQDYDSLATAFHRSGHAVLLLEPRGTGRSVAPQCPTPESWRGREEELDRRVARDVRIGLRALSRLANVDTTRYLLVGGHQLAHVAADAASLDRAVHLLMLVSPEPPEVERGRMRTRLAARRLPVYLQVAVMDAAAAPVADLMFHAVDERVSRLVESRLPGRGAEVFRLDAGAFPRLRSWLAERWTPARTTTPPKRSAPRPGAPRRG